MKLRPSYDDLTPEQSRRLFNGVGPAWAPKFICKVLTKFSGWFFDEASWNHHDFGYYIGYTESHRREYDGKFFEAMLVDARNQVWFKLWLALVLSVLFYLIV